MRTIDQYIEIAKEKQGLGSDRQLGIYLGFTGNPVTGWRTKRSFPADGTMVRLADMAGIDVGEALLDLNIWRSADNEAGPVYSEIAKKIRNRAASIAAASIISGFAILSPADVNATRNLTGTSNTPESISVYYGKCRYDFPKADIGLPPGGFAKAAARYLSAVAVR